MRRLSVANCVRERERERESLVMPNALVTQKLLAIACTLRPFVACTKLLYVLGVEAVVYLGRRPVPSSSGG